MLQLIACVLEAAILIDSHVRGLESWPWFFVFVADLPASLVVQSIANFFNANLNFWAELALTFVLFLVLGTVWWTILAKLVMTLFAWLAGKPKEADEG